MRLVSPANLSFHDRNRVEEVLCAIAHLTAHSTDLPRAYDVSSAVGYDAHEWLVYLARKGLVNAHGTHRDPFYSLSHHGSRAVERYCRRA